MTASYYSYLERHDEWQRAVLLVSKEHSDLDFEEATAARVQVDNRQQALHEAVHLGSQGTWNYLSEVLGVDRSTEIGIDIPSLPNPLTAGEMDSNLTQHAEAEIGEEWVGIIPVAYGATPAFWTLCHSHWIADGMFGEDIAAVFFRNASEQEGRVRNFLRRMGGIPHVRGNVTSLVDCPIAKGWWRWQFVTSACLIAEGAGQPLIHEDAHTALRNAQLWERLVELSLRQLTAITSANARSALIAAFVHNRDRVDALGGRQAARQACQRIAQLSHTHCLDVMEWADLYSAAESALYAD